MKTAVYRHFDAAGRLLYVGMAQNPLQRLHGHKTDGAPWLHEVASVTIAWLDTRAEAVAEEARAIREESPARNRYVPPPPAPAGKAQHRHEGSRHGKYRDIENRNAYMRKYMKQRRAVARAALAQAGKVAQV